MKKRIEKDPDNEDGLVLEFKTTADEHLGHTIEAGETLYDNSVERTVWGHCLTCSHWEDENGKSKWVAVEVMIESVTIVGGLD